MCSNPAAVVEDTTLRAMSDDAILASASEEELEEAGRVSIECLNDRQAGRYFSVEDYLHKYPRISQELLRRVLQATLVFHRAVAPDPPVSMPQATRRRSGATT